MPKFTVMVNDDDEGEDLGEYEADYLPRVGDGFALWHPRVCKDKDAPFLGVVEAVRHGGDRRRQAAERHLRRRRRPHHRVARRGAGGADPLLRLHPGGARAPHEEGRVGRWTRRRRGRGLR